MESIKSNNKDDFSYMPNFYIDIENMTINFLFEDHLQKYYNSYESEYHSHAWTEVQLVIKGDLTIYTDSFQYNLKAGNILIIPENLNHYTNTTENIERVVIGFEYSRGKNYTKEDFYTKFNDYFKAKKCKYFEICEKLSTNISTLYNILSNNPICSQTRIKTCLTDFILNLYAIMAVETKKESCKISKSINDKYFIINDIKSNRLFHIDQFFNMNFRRNITLKELSNQLFLSTKQIQRIIKKEYKMTFHEKLS